MINYYQQDQKSIKRVDELAFKTGWIFGAKNHQKELQAIANKYHLDPNILRDVLDVDELSRIEYDQNQNMYLFLRLINFEENVKTVTYPLLIVITDDILFSLTTGSASLVQQSLDKKEFAAVDQPVQTLVEFLRVVISGYDKVLREAAKKVNQSQALLKKHQITDDDFFLFVEIESQLYDYQQNLSGILAVINRLRDNAHQLFDDYQLEILTDLSLQLKQLQTKVDTNKQNIFSIRKIHKTISDNSLNQRMKVLTVSTLLLAIPNMFYGMYGMNVALPFQKHPAAFFMMVAATLLLTILLIILARKGKMF